MERDAFLARLRSRAAAAPPSHAAHIAPAGSGATAAVYRRSLADAAGVFTEEAAALGVQVRRVPPGGLAAFLGEVVGAHGVRRAVVSRDPETAAVASCLGSLGVMVGSGVGEAAAADLGVTGAVCGIAATGSIVMAADRAGGRSASLLPPVHVALLRRDAILAAPADFFRQRRRFFPAGLPSQVVVISGPSKTSDIELVLVRGVHGPAHVWVGLLDP